MFGRENTVIIAALAYINSFCTLVQIVVIVLRVLYCDLHQDSLWRPVTLVASASTNDLHDVAVAGVIEEGGQILASTYSLHEVADAGVMEEGVAAAAAGAGGIDGIGVADSIGGIDGAGDGAGDGEGVLEPPVTDKAIITIRTTKTNTIPPYITIFE